MTGLALAAALGSALVAGVFFAFSGFVMRGLGELAPARGAEAMRSINRAAVRPPLMVALFGTAALCVAVIVAAAVSWDGAPSAWALAGAAAYLAGAVLVTIVANVPLNDALDREAASLWPRYLRAWTGWNHLRAVASLAASAALIAALATG